MERKTGSIRNTGKTGKTGSFRKTGSLRRPEKGTAPWVLFTTALGVSSQVLGFFSLYYAFRERAFILPLFSVAAPLSGAVVWNRLCKRNGWPFQTGGPEQDPFGVYALIWGFVSFFPVAFCARILTSNFRLNSPMSVLRWLYSPECGQVLLCALLGGLAAVFFYGLRPGLSLRTVLGRGAGSRESLELKIAAAWGLILAAIPAVALHLMPVRGQYRSPRIEGSWEALAYLLPAGLAMAACLLLLSAYFYVFDHRRLDPRGMFRAFVAEFGLGFATFWGLWFLMDWRRFESLTAALARSLDKTF